MSAPVNGTELVRRIMRRQGLKGSPKDYVVLYDHGWLQDGQRTMRVVATLPEVLEAGNHVYVHDRTGQLRPVIVVGDEGESIWVSNGKSEWKLERAECYPTAIPRRPTAVHKSQLARYIGAARAKEFWIRGVGRRTRRR